MDFNPDGAAAGPFGEERSRETKRVVWHAPLTCSPLPLKSLPYLPLGNHGGQSGQPQSKQQSAKDELLRTYERNHSWKLARLDMHRARIAQLFEMLVVSHKASSELLNITASAWITHNGLPRADEQVQFEIQLDREGRL